MFSIVVKKDTEFNCYKRENKEKKNEKGEKALEEDDIVLCLLTSENKKEIELTKVWFAEKII